MKNQLAIALASTTFLYASLPMQAAVLPSGSTYAGKTLYEWSAQWWKTFLEAPANNNPLIAPDSTGSSLTKINNYSSPVFFLTGTLTGVPTNRTVTISDKQAIFFPLFNNISLKTDPTDTAASLCKQTTDVVDGIDQSSLFASLNGVDISNLPSYRESCSTQPNNGSFVVQAGTKSLLANFLGAGDYLSASDGYWLLLEPLDVGNYTLKFGGGGQDNTYTITVSSSIPESSSVFGLLTLGILGVGLTLKKNSKQKLKEKELTKIS